MTREQVVPPTPTSAVVNTTDCIIGARNTWLPGTRPDTVNRIYCLTTVTAIQ